MTLMLVGITASCAMPSSTAKWKSERARPADRYSLAPGEESVYCMYYDTSLARMRCCCWPLYGSYPVIFGREESQRSLSAED